MAETPSRRPPPSLKIKCKSATLEDFLNQFGQDISRRGVFVKTKSPLKNGTALRFEFQLADATPAFGGIGKVVWRRAARSGELPSGMGIEFIDLPDESRQLVERVANIRVGMMSRFDQQNDADIDPVALRASIGPVRDAPASAPTAPVAPGPSPSLPRGLLANSARPPPPAAASPAAGLFRESRADAAAPSPAAVDGPLSPAAPAPAGSSSQPPPSREPSPPPPYPAATPADVVISLPPPLPRHDASAAEEATYAEPDGSGPRPTPLPDAPHADDLAARAAVDAAATLEAGSELPTAVLGDEADAFRDDEEAEPFEADDYAEGFGDFATGFDEDLADDLVDGSELDGSARPSAGPSASFEERLASLAPPPPRRGWIVVVSVVVLLLAAGAGYLVFSGDRSLLEPLLDWVDRF